MRISDWSSDVCSSDLVSRRQAAPCLSSDRRAMPPRLWLDEMARSARRVVRPRGHQYQHRHSGDQKAGLIGTEARVPLPDAGRAIDFSRPAPKEALALL